MSRDRSQPMFSVSSSIRVLQYEHAAVRAGREDHMYCFFFFFQAEDGIRDVAVTGVQTCALPIYGVVVRLDSKENAKTGHAPLLDITLAGTEAATKGPTGPTGATGATGTAGATGEIGRASCRERV